MAASGFGGAGYYPTYSQYGHGGTVVPQQQQPPVYNYNIPPPPPQYQLPPPQTTNWLNQLQNLVPNFGNLQAYAPLSPDVLSLLNQSKEAQMTMFNDTANQMQDRQLASLFGNGVERSSIASDAATRLAGTLAADKAGILQGDAAARLGAMFNSGQFGLNALNAQAGVLGQGAGLANQLYATQSGNVLQQQQLAQNYQSQQQDYLLRLLSTLIPSLQGMIGGSGGAGQYPFSGGGGGGGVGGSGSFGGVPSASWWQNQQQYLTPYQMQQKLWQYLLSYLNTGGYHA